MPTHELVKVEAALAAECTFSSAIPIHGKFNVSVAGTFEGTVNLQRKFPSDDDISGEATATTSDKLVDSAMHFDTNGVRIGDWVHNTTDDTWAMITAIDSATTLSIDNDIMADEEEYTIERWWNLPDSFEVTAPADACLEEVEGGVQYRIGIVAGEYTSGTAYARVSK